MVGKYIDLSKAQKEEIRRLTQLANRRIKAAFKAYEKEGMRITPREVTGNIQIREQWYSEKYALSRSVRFETQKEYRQHLHYLRQFEHARPGIKEYTQAQREKTLDAIETSLGEVPKDLQQKIMKMNAPQLAKFWEKFSEKSQKLGLKYASDKAMEAALHDFFPEDVQSFNKAG